MNTTNAPTTLQTLTRQHDAALEALRQARIEHSNAAKLPAGCGRPGRFDDACKAVEVARAEASRLAWKVSDARRYA